MDDRLWNDVHEHEKFSEWNCSADDDEILNMRTHHSREMLMHNKPEIITSSVNDCVCDISSISSDARYSHPEVDKDLIPGKLTMLNTDWAKRN